MKSLRVSLSSSEAELCNVGSLGGLCEVMSTGHGTFLKITVGRFHKRVFPSLLPSLTLFLMQTVALESPFGEITQSPLPTLPFECEVQKNPDDSVIWDSISLQIIAHINFIQVRPPDEDRLFGSWGGGLGDLNMKKLFH